MELHCVRQDLLVCACAVHIDCHTHIHDHTYIHLIFVCIVLSIPLVSAINLGVVSSTRVRMTKPLLLPEPYGGEACGWAEWVDHFESVAAVNK